MSSFPTLVTGQTPANAVVQVQPGMNVQPVVLVNSLGQFVSTGLTLQATTGVAGTALVNGTPTILSWTAPNDGQMHRAVLIVSQHVTSSETGGQLAYMFNAPDGSGPAANPFAGNFGVGFAGIINVALIAPGSVFSFKQNTALTVGAAMVWAEIWGS